MRSSEATRVGGDRHSSDFLRRCVDLEVVFAPAEAATLSVKVVPIEVTKLEKELKFPRLVLYFSESAARLEDLKKTSLQGVRLGAAAERHMALGPRPIFSCSNRAKIGRRIRNLE